MNRFKWAIFGIICNLIAVAAAIFAFIASLTLESFQVICPVAFVLILIHLFLCKLCISNASDAATEIAKEWTAEMDKMLERNR